jgi:hypothetical protein
MPRPARKQNSQPLENIFASVQAELDTLKPMGRPEQPVDTEVDLHRELIREELKRTIRPYEFTKSEVLSVSGLELWQMLSEMEANLDSVAPVPAVPKDFILESGTSEPFKYEGKFMDTGVFASTSPGLPYGNGEKQPNKSGVVLYPDNKDRIMTAVLVDSVSHDSRNGCGLANGAAITASHDIAQNVVKWRLPQILYRINNTVLDLQEQMNHSAPSVSVAAVRLDMEKKSKKYFLEVASAGDIHVLVISPSGKVRSLPVQTVGEILRRKTTSKHGLEKIVLSGNGDKEKREKAAKNVGGLKKGLGPADRDKILAEYAEKSDVSVDEAERKIMIGAGLNEEDFKPETDVIPVKPNDIVVLANSHFMAAISQNPVWQDDVLARKIIYGLADGKELNEICTELTETAKRLQEKKKVEDASQSLIAFEVPPFP